MRRDHHPLLSAPSALIRRRRAGIDHGTDKNSPPRTPKFHFAPFTHLEYVSIERVTCVRTCLPPPGGILRSPGAAGRALIKSRWNALRERWRLVFSGDPVPSDVWTRVVVTIPSFEGGMPLNGVNKDPRGKSAISKADSQPA